MEWEGSATIACQIINPALAEIMGGRRLSTV
jgi:hypothetical protein